jgi:UDP-N-acetylglucosamine:LPS N-acetylglucosamine transferase
MIPLLQEASLVICRSGYSTLMDLAAFQKKAILIPTPGQTEQEYLGKQLHENGIFYCAPQVGFNLENALKAIEKFPFHPLNLTTGLQQYKTVISEWLQRLES